jgi:hypothetical protein
MQKTIRSSKGFQTVVMFLVLVSMVTPGITGAGRYLGQDHPPAG